MEGFTSSFLNSKPSSISFIADIDHNMELLLNPFAIQYHDNDQLNTSSSSNSSHQSFMGFTNDNNFFSQPLVDHHQFLQSFQLPVFQDIEKKNVMMINNPESAAAPTVGRVGMNGKRKAAMDVSSTTNSGNSSTHPLPEVNEIDEKKYQSSGGKGKKVKLSQINGETSKEVVHVRARRGQATDSHSIAERVRRGKINERLRCLQDIVPGCYKSMGMAVMLDEIINYVQSLQNQVEFLSMKLTEASRFHNFDSDLMHMDVLQMGNVIEGLRMQRLEEREEIGPVDQSFGSYPSLPYHTT